MCFLMHMFHIGAWVGQCWRGEGGGALLAAQAPPTKLREEGGASRASPNKRHVLANQAANAPALHAVWVGLGYGAFPLALEGLRTASRRGIILALLHLVQCSCGRGKTAQRCSPMLILHASRQTALSSALSSTFERSAQTAATALCTTVQCQSTCNRHGRTSACCLVRLGRQAGPRPWLWSRSYGPA